MRWRRGAEERTEEPAATPARPRPSVPVDLGAVATADLTRATRRIVARALTEDLAGEQDLTSALTVPVGTTGRAVLVAREAGVLAGADLVREVCSQVDHRLVVHLKQFDGDRVAPGTVVAEVDGPLRTLLTAERTALNLVCHLSGVATRTRAFADVLEGTDCVVRDTRKTTPGLRLLEKHAVECGGGANHRIGLYDAVLVKDNHVAAAGSVTAAARAALERAPEGVHVQVEVTSLAEAEEAMAVGVTDLLLDNFTPDELRAAVEAIDGRAAVEASGGITLATARAFAEAGADRLAVGALTHSAPSLDLALDVVEVTPPSRPAAMTRFRSEQDAVQEDVAEAGADPAVDGAAADVPAPAGGEAAPDEEAPAEAAPDRVPDPPQPPPPPPSDGDGDGDGAAAGAPAWLVPEAAASEPVPDPPEDDDEVTGYDPTEALFGRAAERSDA